TSKKCEMKRVEFRLNETGTKGRALRDASSGPTASYRSRPGYERVAGQARRGPAYSRHFMTTREDRERFLMIGAVMRIDLIKYQALGNDYLVLDLPGPLDEVVALLPSLCDRHLGLGSDGLLAYDPQSMTVRIFNPDRSEAQKSGNGLRITAAHAVLVHGAGERFELRTADRANPVRVLSTDGAEITSELDIGRPSFRAADLPASFDGEPAQVELETPAGRVEAVLVSVGNPH